MNSVINNVEFEPADFCYGKNRRHLLMMPEYYDEKLGRTPLARKLLEKGLIAQAAADNEIGVNIRLFISELAEKLASRGGKAGQCCLALHAIATYHFNRHKDQTIDFEGSEGRMHLKTVHRHLSNAYVIVAEELNKRSETPREGAVRDLGKIVSEYLTYMHTELHVLNLRGIKSANVIQIELEDAYVPLSLTDNSWSHEEGEPSGTEQTLTLEEALSKYSYLVIIGAPGSGKSIFLHYIAITLAKSILRQEPGIATGRLGLTGQIPVPIFVPLREFRRYLQKNPGLPDLNPSAFLLFGFIHEFVRSQQPAIREDILEQKLKEGACILLLDGLDEVASENDRVFVREALENFVNFYPRNRYVVTSRTVAYKGDARLGTSFGVCSVNNMSREQIEEFITRWNRALLSTDKEISADQSARQARAYVKGLMDTIDKMPEIGHLAKNPLLLTVILIVHHNRRQLPEQRAELYEECTSVLLGQWDAARPGFAGKELEQFAGVDRPMSLSEKRGFLERLALYMHEKEVQEIDQQELVEVIGRRFEELEGIAKYMALESAGKFVEAITVRSGLLEELRPTTYGFSHLAFQEFFSARHIAGKPDKVQRDLVLRHLRADWWKEVILLTIGFLGYHSQERAMRLVETIASQGDCEEEQALNLILSARCLLNLRYYQVESKVQKGIVKGLLRVLEADWRSVGLETRIEAGDALGSLGDPRLTKMIVIPTGNFAMGEKPNEIEAYVEAFKIAKYPVTNIQYHTFVKATGRRAPTGWENEHYPLGRANHPVTRVTFEDAKAYAEWAGLRLPTEIEWEKATRGSGGIIYPWGDQPDITRCNLWESGIRNTTPVGTYPNGVSPYGVADMIGNVWEWTLNKESESRGVLRGGSWNTLQSNVRSSARYTDPPPHLLALVGFRCAR